MQESNKAKKKRAKKVGVRRRRLAGLESRGMPSWRKESEARRSGGRDALRYCTLQTRSVPGVVPQSVPIWVALVIDNQVFD